MADNPRLCRIGLPLIAVDPVRLAEASTKFESLLGPMARPLHVLLIGGDMGAARLDPTFAVDILARMRSTFASTGSIFVSTSRRTPADVTDAVERNLGPGDRIYRWTAAAGDNPYLGLLAHGDTFTVTADSLSMLTEVARLGKPLVIAEAPQRPDLLHPVKSLLGLKPVRDLSQAAAYLIEGDYAVRLGEPPKLPPAPPPDDTGKVAERLRQLAMA
jgi:mitochondrial fission protein ELM1